MHDIIWSILRALGFYKEYFISREFGRIPIPKGTILNIHGDIERICRQAREDEAIIKTIDAKARARMKEYWINRKEYWEAEDQQ